MEIFSTIFVIFITFLGAWFAWESTLMVSEKKARFRAGTHDYYDNPIKKEEVDEQQ